MENKPLIDAKQLRDDLAFSDVDLSSAMMSQASMFAHYAVISANAQKQVDQAKMRLEIVESKVDRAIRNKAADEGEKMTEPRVAAAVARNREVVAAKLKVNDAKMIADIAKNALEAFKQRRDMLIQIGVAQREELKGEARVAAGKLERQQRRDRVIERIKQDQERK